MKSETIRVGERYAAKVSGKTVEVRIERVNPRGGWDAVSLGNNKTLRIKKGQSLRPLPEPDEPPLDGPVQAAVEQEEAVSAPMPAPAEETPAAQTLDAASEEEKIPLTKAMGTQKKGDRGGKKVPAKPSTPLATPKALSCLDAAAAVLKDLGTPMGCKALINEMHSRKLWSSDAPTPAATLSSALQREIKVKGSHSRFRKADRGLFALNDV